jgi:hypothetical protein
MRYLKENHREFFQPHLIYMAGASAGVEAKESKVEVEAEKEPKEGAEKSASEGATPQDIWDTYIEPDYSPEAYETKAQKTFDEIYKETIKAAADKTAPQQEAIIDKEDLIKRSVESYSKGYKSVLNDFLTKGNELYADKNKAIEKVQSKTKDELKFLRGAITKGAEARDAGKEAEKESEKLSKWLDGQKDVLAYPSKKEVIAKFTAYIKALNGHYLNADWQKARLMKPGERTWGIPIFYPNLNRNRAFEFYREKSGKFKKAMLEKYSANLEYLLSVKTTDKETFKNLQKQIEDEYIKYASLDGRPGMIDLEDLGKSEQIASPSLDILALINTTGENADKNMLEAIQLMNPEAWQTAVKMVKKTIINDAINNGANGKFIEAANKWRENEGKKALNTFAEAKDYFENTIDTYAGMGALKTYELVTHFNAVVNENRIAILDSVSPKSLHGLVYRERERLLSRRMAPQREGDRLIVEFVSADLKGRKKILAERGDELFREIKNVQTHYQKTYQDRYSRNIPKEVGKLVTNSKDREKPTQHDKAARMQAMIMISKEAEWIVRNFGASDKKLIDRFESVSADKEPVQAGWRFTDTRKSRYQPYKSSISRGGFNGRDLSLTGLKVFGAITVIANGLNAIRDVKGEDFFDTVTKAVERVVTNPGVLAGAAAAFGAHTLQRNPEYFSYLSESEYGRLQIDSTRKLRGLAGRAGRGYLKKFVHNNSEWKAMDKLEAGQIKSLMKKSAKKRPPTITKEDLAAYVTDKEALVGVAEDPNSAHLRYEFYRRFITGKEKPNIKELKKICQGNKIVS